MRDAPSKLLEEVFDRYASLFEGCSQRAYGNDRMKRDHASRLILSHDNVTAPLADLSKPQAFQSADGFLAGNLPQVRHILPQK